jgi:hypothetical protein
VRHPGGGVLAKFRDAADGDARHWRLVRIGSLSRWQASQKFSRIKAESEYGAAEFLTEPVDFDQLKIQRNQPGASRSASSPSTTTAAQRVRNLENVESNQSSRS